MPYAAPKRATWCWARRALLLSLPLAIAHCAGHQSHFAVFNPDKRIPLFATSRPKVVVGVTDPAEGVFDTADWAFIRHRAPWNPLSRALSEWTDARIQFRQLTPFQIAHLMQARRCDFALVSADQYAELKREGAAVSMVARAEPYRRQGVLVAAAHSQIRSLADLRGEPFAFGPRTDPVLFFQALEVLDEAGISPSDLKKELVLTGFDGALQNHRSSRSAAREIVYGVRAQAGVIEAAEYESYPETGGRWLPLHCSFSKDQFVELARTDSVEAVTIRAAVLVAANHVSDTLIRRFQEFLISAHVRDPETIHALGFGRFSMPPMQQEASSGPRIPPSKSKVGRS